MESCITPVWIDNFRYRSDRLSGYLESNAVWTHPFVIGELACGALVRRDEILNLLAALPCAPVVEHGEVLDFLRAHRLGGQGLGWVDVHLLASAHRAGLPLWTRDRRLERAAGAVLSRSPTA
jgi:predicted nucleic acid-binding protein